MASLNEVNIMGNLGADPEVRTFPNGDLIAVINVATSEKWKDKNTGEDRELVEWHRIVFYRKLAEIASKFLKKGSGVFVKGKLRTRKWTDQNGQERYLTEIQADNLQMLPSSGQQTARTAPVQNPSPQNTSSQSSEPTFGLEHESSGDSAITF